MATVPPNSGWSAKLRLGFRRSPHKTLLAERHRQGPLAVQKALYPEGDVCHVYLLHPPGGVAGGDQLHVQAHLAAHTSALITTPGAAKFYRSVGPWAEQTQYLSVDNGCLEWLPQENIFFPQAKAKLTTEVHLNQNARFIGWEINCLGRPVIQESFGAGKAIFQFRLYKDGLPLLLERLPVLDNTMLNGVANLRGQPVFASLYATPTDDKMLHIARATLPEQYKNQCAITCVDEVLIARYLGNSTEIARQLFVKIWTALRPLVLKREACVPRIWLT